MAVCPNPKESVRKSALVDVIDAYGSPILCIQTNDPVENMAFGGADLETLYLVGIGWINKVTWDLEGPDHNNYYTEQWDEFELWLERCGLKQYQSTFITAGTKFTSSEEVAFRASIFKE